MSNPLEEIKGIYTKFKVSPDGEKGELPLDEEGRWTLKAEKNENPDNWKVHDAVTGEFFKMPSRGIPAAMRAIAGEFICTYKDVAPKDEPVKDPIENLKDGGFEIEPVKQPEEVVKVESFEEPEQPKKQEWTVGGKQSVVRRIDTGTLESINLPAPVGVGGIVRPAVTAQQALAAWKEFQELKKYIIEPSDLQEIEVFDKRSGKKKKTSFVKKSGWRKFATFYNLTDRIVEETKEPVGQGGFLWKIKVVCMAPNGRETEGVGMCSSTERGFAHPDHDIYATAHTRAKNRAISDMIAAGEMSAEEVDA